LRSREGGHLVEDDHADVLRIFATLGCSRAGSRLNERVEYPSVLIRPGAVPGDRGIDEFWPDRGQGFVAEPHAIEDTGAVVLDERVGGSNEIEEDRSLLVDLQIETHRFLVAVDRGEHRRHTVPSWSEEPRSITGERRLDLEDLGALIGQGHRRHRAGDRRRQLQDPVAIERALSCLPHGATVVRIRRAVPGGLRRRRRSNRSQT